ncbi:MarR family transcriptional regulator [Streptomyces cinereoruber]|uniref:MarR family transcriptional regulator n=1 Tax=Streptomyces cinereoruber TaxID=67260 RepID=A0AAV4K9T5_9ACTN|nr:MarR family transcriptional regulator [Streptomyces cinereoruber]MBB4157339.1 DNA-binding MarR family transcriptional regulator [Streptomyces cinereoruber]MBY8814848.1 MarR family transcriptional regulator [Streptomyces cinereoruber]NIH59563.1 DNA-binding MarR family transcriptional regulator [Streptomyces cinereoruber]QEV34543.1 MarR family transcriptional regulator [Streptomyces cinereoruber]GGR06324.1 MarR family transcriptional regulator [Streptomyces cinereoruber]
MSDAVDVIIGQWVKERPDAAEDLWPVELFARIQRLARVVDKSAKATAAAHGVEHGEFDVLTTLQRSGPPYALTAGAFLKASMVTSGAITNRIDKMEAKGLVERVRESDDRRTVKIRLTARGHEVTRVAFADHLANYAQLLAGVDRGLVEKTAQGLRQVLEALGDTTVK